MSSSLYVHAVDLEEVHRIRGSGDEALLASLLEQGAGRLADHDAYFAHFPQVANYTPLAQALSQIVRGRIDVHLTPRFQFEHAIALLVDLTGEPLDADAFAECSPALRDEVDTAIQRCLEASGQDPIMWPKLQTVLQREPFLDVPLDPSWPLGSGYLTAAEVQVAWLAALSCSLDGLEDILTDLAWPDEAIGGARQYQEWLEHAARAGKGLFFHC